MVLLHFKCPSVYYEHLQFRNEMASISALDIVGKWATKVAEFYNT